MQNTSHAVMAQRVEPRDSLDDFPTPPWATRALLEHVIRGSVKDFSCLEPACGRGYMARPLSEYFREVVAQDIADYEFGSIQNYLDCVQNREWDWIITNPPFRLAEDFIMKALDECKKGCAFLVRTTFLESIGRFNRIFSLNPPSVFAQFVERVPMVKGRLDPKATTATGYCWLVWDKHRVAESRVVWIPPCRRTLERHGDYPKSELLLM
ncbi:hypothetical protein [Novosphingobium sp. MMS21-SN21R]|uniref:hypothetical protein n=1 Tax=Novosphingobium sp. MMS21-SN21R TaxID=2969298 RepID=UPI002884D9CF|nr:hypothetical protein [Novosphingobium sp. MMS21-SN21R]MDT0509259.1 hypothetical protein [Novosphingobium sp. MMS21-SN21R]